MYHFIDKVYEAYYSGELNGVYKFLQNHNIPFKPEFFQLSNENEVMGFIKQNYCFATFNKPFEVVRIRLLG